MPFSDNVLIKEPADYVADLKYCLLAYSFYAEWYGKFLDNLGKFFGDYCFRGDNYRMVSHLVELPDIFSVFVSI